MVAWQRARSRGAFADLRVRLRTVALRRPVILSALLAATALGLLWAGHRLVRWLLPGNEYLRTIERLPVLLFVLLLLALGQWWRAAGFRRPRLRGLLAAWPIALLLAYLATLVPWRGNGPVLPLIANQCVTAFWEEALFRGVVLFVLARRSPTLALFGSAILFGGIHGFNISGAPTFGLSAWNLLWPVGVGLLFGVLRARTGSIWPPMIAHFLNNVGSGLAPTPLTWSGIVHFRVPLELILFLALFVCCGLATLPRCRPVVRVANVAIVLGIAWMCVLGGVALDGPRPGWEGPGWDWSLNVASDRRGDTWEYSYRLSFDAEQAEVVTFALRIDGNPPVEGLRARAGGLGWDGAVDDRVLVWKGGHAPVTTYRFRSALPPEGRTVFRIVFRDRYGYTRTQEGSLDSAPGWD